MSRLLAAERRRWAIAEAAQGLTLHGAGQEQMATAHNGPMRPTSFKSDVVEQFRAAGN